MSIYETTHTLRLMANEADDPRIKAALFDAAARMERDVAPDAAQAAMTAAPVINERRRAAILRKAQEERDAKGTT